MKRHQKAVESGTQQVNVGKRKQLLPKCWANDGRLCRGKNARDQKSETLSHSGRHWRALKPVFETFRFFPVFTSKRIVGTHLYPIDVVTESQMCKSFGPTDLHTRDGRTVSRRDRREGERNEANVYTAIYVTALQLQRVPNSNEGAE